VLETPTVTPDTSSFIDVKHSTQQGTADILNKLIVDIKAHGYRLVTVAECSDDIEGPYRAPLTARPAAIADPRVGREEIVLLKDTARLTYYNSFPTCCPGTPEYVSQFAILQILLELCIHGVDSMAVTCDAIVSHIVTVFSGRVLFTVCCHRYNATAPTEECDDNSGCLYRGTQY
jgi:hypothetical protein